MAATAPSDAKAPVKINAADLSALIANMSRLLVGLGSIPPFKNANLGLAEWVGLSVLAQKDGVSNKQLARILGVTGQRANQISTSLTKAGLISIAQSSEDNRRNEIKITDAGKSRFNSVNTELESLLSVALKNKERSLLSAGKQVRLMMRIVQVGAPDAPLKKNRNKGAKGAGRNQSRA